ncbi:hypothetical protein Syun_019810 [Stephania yunnanensis]|uniref:Uncharacterized protein n=1 Tax=Stephania yunnanensis TaxID=152371 RepID=A0AAP0IWH8_9MAGN
MGPLPTSRTANKSWYNSGVTRAAIIARLLQCFWSALKEFILTHMQLLPQQELNMVWGSMLPRLTFAAKCGCTKCGTIAGLDHRLREFMPVAESDLKATYDRTDGMKWSYDGCQVSGYAGLVGLSSSVATSMLLGVRDSSHQDPLCALHTSLNWLYVATYNFLFLKVYGADMADPNTGNKRKKQLQKILLTRLELLDQPD